MTRKAMTKPAAAASRGRAAAAIQGATQVQAQDATATQDATAAAAKAGLRRAMRQRLAGLSAAERAEASARICAWLLAEPTVATAPGLVLFAAHGAEPDLRALAVAALERGLPIAYPRSAGEIYEPVRVTDLAADLVPGRYGILEPRATLPALDAAEVAGWTWLVPGVAFTRCGDRLGHGGGYYDRLLAAVHGARIGVAQASQTVDALPTAAHDIPLTALVTPAGFQRCAQAPPGSTSGSPPASPPGDPPTLNAGAT